MLDYWFLIKVLIEILFHLFTEKQSQYYYTLYK